jgi:inorganic phosphate transporter, PiT family
VDLSLSVLLVIIVLALIFDFINGFHDTANAIATVVSTRVMTPRFAIIMAATLNLIGALMSTKVAHTVGAGLVVSVGQATVIAALISAITWDLITWYFGLPTSSSHALLSSLVGAGIAEAGRDVLVWKGIEKVLLALILSPLIGFIFGLVLMVALFWAFSKSRPSTVTGVFKNLQIFSAAIMAYSHGHNDAQKTMGIIALALMTYHGATELVVPLWVILACAVAMAMGTAAGGWRIIKTLGMRLVALRPIHGFAAEASAATVIEVASHMGLPVSTTHVISSTIMGVGASRRLSAVRWGIGGKIVMAWILTLPACGLLAWVLCRAILSIS